MADPFPNISRGASTYLSAGVGWQSRIGELLEAHVAGRDAGLDRRRIGIVSPASRLHHGDQGSFVG